MNLDPIAHFQKISKLLIQTEVTNSSLKTMPLFEGCSKAVEMILAHGKKIMVIGNGGSAAIASHFHNDLCHTVGMQAMVFTDLAQLTALSNDHGYESVFSRPVELWAQTGDLLVAISSSGKSENILQAVQSSQKKGCNIITFSGFQPDNPLRRLGQLNFYVSSSRYGEVEVAHLSLAHFLTDSAVHARLELKNVPE